jgi:hypothetical protein
VTSQKVFIKSLEVGRVSTLVILEALGILFAYV